MKKQDIADKLKEVDEQKKVDTYLHQLENEQNPITLTEFEKNLVPKEKMNAPTHHEKVRFHKEHHKPADHLIQKKKD